MDFWNKNSFGLLKDKCGTYYAYMPDVSNVINMNTYQIVKGNIYVFILLYVFARKQ